MRPELIQAAELLRRNTPEDVEQAIALLQSTVYSFSMKMCGHREDAEDTTQDVLFKSLRHLSRFPDPSALAAWLYTVTRNRCRRIRRPHADAPGKSLSLDELMPGELELQQLLEPNGSESPERNVLHAEQHHLLHEAVLHIPTSLRIVLVLHDMEELTTEQVAQILGLQPGTVRVRLHRARLSVRQEMSRVLRQHMKAPEPHAASERTALRRRKVGPECRELFANLSDYLDKRVDAASCEEMKKHIDSCPNCVAFLKDLRAAIDRCKSMNMECDPAVAARMRELFTREYLRMLKHPDAEPAAHAR